MTCDSSSTAATDEPRPADSRAEAFQEVRSARRNELAEDYVELIAELIHEHGEARPVAIAARMGVRPSVCVYTMALAQVYAHMRVCCRHMHACMPYVHHVKSMSDRVCPKVCTDLAVIHFVLCDAGALLLVYVLAILK